MKAPKTSRNRQRWMQKDSKFLAVNMDMSTKSIQLQTGHTLFCWSKYNSANEIMSILTISCEL